MSHGVDEMKEGNKKRRGHGWLAVFIPLLLFDLGILIYNLVGTQNIALFDTKGLIAHEQRELMVVVMAILLVATIPTLFVLYYIAWKYRDSNTKATYDPDAKPRTFTASFMWGFPLVFLVIIGMILWPATHRLEPKKPIASDAEPITIQVVALRWKWLFLYPEQQIATVNFVQIPEDTPVRFELTADEAPMSSFWIPNLGGQLYAMTSHVNALHLIGDTPGDYPGSTAELNGAGFAGMRFTARVSSAADFESWVKNVKQSEDILSASEYAELLKPSENNPLGLYANYQSDLYARITDKYMGAHASHGTTNTEHEGH